MHPLASQARKLFAPMLIRGIGQADGASGIIESDMGCALGLGPAPSRTHTQLRLSPSQANSSGTFVTMQMAFANLNGGCAGNGTGAWTRALARHAPVDAAVFW